MIINKQINKTNAYRKLPKIRNWCMSQIVSKGSLEMYGSM